MSESLIQTKPYSLIGLETAAESGIFPTLMLFADSSLRGTVLDLIIPFVLAHVRPNLAYQRQVVDFRKVSGSND